MDWYGKEHLDPAKTKKLMKKWQAPPANAAAAYYNLFPDLEPHWLPVDHYIVKYNEERYPKNRDYRTFKEAPKEIKSKHFIEWEDGYGPCNVCEECVSAKKQNEANASAYYKALAAWRDHGTPM